MSFGHIWHIYRNRRVLQCQVQSQHGRGRNYVSFIMSLLTARTLIIFWELHTELRSWLSYLYNMWSYYLLFLNWSIWIKDEHFLFLKQTAEGISCCLFSDALSFHLYWVLKVGLEVHEPCLSDGDDRGDSRSDLLLTRYL